MKRLAAMGLMAMLAVALFATWQAPARSQAAEQFSAFDPEGPYTRLIDVGSEGFGAGDYILERHPLLDPASGDQIGKAVTKVTIVRTIGEADALFIIDCTIKLADGDIVFYGASRFSSLADGADFAVTGGTGAHTGTEGVVTIAFSELDGRAGALLEFDVT